MDSKTRLVLLSKRLSGRRCQTELRVRVLRVASLMHPEDGLTQTPAEDNECQYTDREAEREHMQT